MNRYDRAFINMAFAASTLSKDPSTKVGCVIVDPSRRQIAMGFNGFPPSVPDDEAVLAKKCCMDVHGCRVDEGMDKYDLIIHAELNAMLNAKFDLGDSTMYTTLAPCAQCAKHIVAAGISRLVCVDATGQKDLLYDVAKSVLELGGVRVEYIHLP